MKPVAAAAFLLAGLLSAQPQVRLTDQRIVQLVASGVSEEEILRIIQTTRAFDFDLRPPSTDAMLQAGVSEDIIKAMAARESGEPRRSPPPAATNAAPKPLSLPSSAPSTSPPAGAVSASVSSSTRFDQPPRPIFAPLPELPPDAKPLAPGTQPGGETASDGYTLSDQQVAQLIQDGLSSARPLGVSLADPQTGLFGSSSCSACTQPPFTIVIYTREDWIQLAARHAKREMQPFSVADVPPAMRLPLLYVTAPQSAAQPSSDGNGYSAARRIVLRDPSGRSTIQPLELPEAAIQSNRTFKWASAGIDAVAFQVSDANALRSSDAKGEFFVDVADANGNQYFKVRTENLRALFGAASSASASGTP